MAKTNFSNGNASQGVLGTVVSAEFMNSMFATNGGHKHDGADNDGHAGKINLATETEGQLPASAVDLQGVIGTTIDGGGAAIAVGVAGDIIVPFNCTILGVVLLADQAGNAVVDLWKNIYANYPPTVADTITAAAKPTLINAVKSQDDVLTGWSRDMNKGDILRVNVDSVAAITWLIISLAVVRR